MHCSLDNSDPRFPSKLLSLNKSCPNYLHYVGELDLLSRPRIAVVGSRAISEYGEFILNNHVKELLDYDVTLISGFVRGVDLQVLEISSRMCCGSLGVLGTGLDVACNGALSAILKKNLEFGGLFISEFPSLFPGRKWSFYKRNRLIACLADAVLVIEAASKSGSLVTASWAHRLGIPIYVFSFPLGMPNTLGMEFICQTYNAQILTSIKPLVQILNLQAKHKENHNIKAVDAIQDRILEILKRKPSTLEELLHADTHFDLVSLNSSLFDLVVAGVLFQKKGKYYAT